MKRSMTWLAVLACVALGALPEPARGEEPALRLVPEWELSGPIVLVWPEHLRGARRLNAPFTAFIRTLPEDVEVAVISPRPPGMRALQELGRDVRYLPLERVRDVYVRDWAGLPAADPEGRLSSAKFRYRPAHVEGRDVAEAHDGNLVAKKLAERLYGAVTEIPLTMSGSAITHNGRGVALISQRVIHENEHLSLQEIRDILKAHAGLAQVVFVPVKPGDAKGHVSGLVRFASERTVLIAQYPDTQPERFAFSERLAAQLRRELGDAFRVVPVPLAENGGSYLDYISLDGRLWLPLYGVPEDQDALSTIARALPDLEIDDVDARPYGELIEQGYAPWRLHVVH